MQHLFMHLFSFSTLSDGRFYICNSWHDSCLAGFNGPKLGLAFANFWQMKLQAVAMIQPNKIAAIFLHLPFHKSSRLPKSTEHRHHWKGRESTRKSPSPKNSTHNHWMNERVCLVSDNRIGVTSTKEAKIQQLFICVALSSVISTMKHGEIVINRDNFKLVHCSWLLDGRCTLEWLDPALSGRMIDFQHRLTFMVITIIACVDSLCPVCYRQSASRFGSMRLWTTLWRH